MVFRYFKKIIYLIYRKTAPVSFARHIGVKVGDNCRLIDVDFGSEPWLISLGSHVSATNVSFITHDGGVWVFRDTNPDIDVIRPITVGDNVFIGHGSVIMPGVMIGNNVVIGAGSVVTRDIQSGFVAAGVPAKVVKSVDEYYEKIMTNFDLTKNMHIDEKKIYYLTKYHF
ncbi:MAG: acyltransferase [Caldilineaceae bacterium]|nr:acyltransferase [Caldilineaceae bacterium]